MFNENQIHSGILDIYAYPTITGRYKQIILMKMPLLTCNMNFAPPHTSAETVGSLWTIVSTTAVYLVKPSTNGCSTSLILLVLLEFLCEASSSCTFWRISCKLLLPNSNGSWGPLLLTLCRSSVACSKSCSERGRVFPGFRFPLLWTQLSMACASSSALFRTTNFEYLSVMPR